MENINSAHCSKTYLKVHNEVARQQKQIQQLPKVLTL